MDLISILIVTMGAVVSAFVTINFILETIKKH